MLQQYRKDQIKKHNARIYNCVVSHLDSIEKINKAFYLSLCGCGVTLQLHKKFVSKLPNIIERSDNTVKNFVIDDSIEGWSDSVGVLLSSFCDGEVPFPEYQGCVVRFDYSEIRSKGSLISGGFKAPGSEGLKQSLERIEKLLDSVDKNTQLKSIDAYDCLMHCADATLSGGVRRAAMAIMIDPTDTELINAKTGNWRETNKQRERSNNSVILIRDQFTKKDFDKFFDLNSGMSDIGFVFCDDTDVVMNPCFEIGFSPILPNGVSAFQFCNLTEINAIDCMKNGKIDKEKFYKACESASVIATLQAGYTDFPYLGKDSEDITKKEALIGVSITGWMDNPELFDEEILNIGVSIVNKTNEKVANMININPAARTTAVKPSGNASTLLKTASGIHPEHAKTYFRLMQINKYSEIGNWLGENAFPEMIEDSVWSATNSDYVIYIPVENDPNALFKEQMKGVAHLEKIKLVQNTWIAGGKHIERCNKPYLMNNVSCTVIIDDIKEISDYVFKNQKTFTAISFLSDFGDKDYPQSPFTSVFNSQELLDKYGDAVIFASGIIVDGLHYFDNDLWDACDFVLNKNKKFVGTRTEIILKEDWVRRAKQFAKNNFKGDIQKMIYCLKDVHLWHKWLKINRNLKSINFEEILLAPKYNDVNEYAATACSGGACEIKRI